MYAKGRSVYTAPSVTDRSCLGRAGIRCTAGTISLAVFAAFIFVINLFYNMPLDFMDTMEMAYIDDNITLSDSPMSYGMTIPKIPVRTSLSDSELDDIKRRFDDRRDRLHEMCEKRKEPFNNFSKKRAAVIRAGKRSEVLEKYKLMYCEVYKAGSTAWNSLMAHLYNENKIIDSKEFYRMQPILKPTSGRFNDVIKDKNFWRLFVAREPLSRFLSAYRDRIEDTSHPSWQASHYAPLILKYTRNQRYNLLDVVYPNQTIKIIPTFDEFARYVVSINPTLHDPHWMPVSVQCGVCDVNYTHIIHSETFIDDVRYVMRATGMDQKIDASLLTLNAHKGKGNTTELMMAYYSTLKPSTLQKLVTIYRDDFVFFDYDPTPILKEIFPNVTIKV